MSQSVDNSIWHNRRVFLTGHTGFKGGWLALWLASKGAIVRGYSLDPSTTPNLFTEARIGSVLEDIRGDIRNATALNEALTTFAPEVVFHLAAQPLVRYSYDDPIGTFETNVIGTARLLDAVRRTPSVRAVGSVTTDKCYENKEWLWGYRETDPLGGYDPYSSSKACAEIVSAAFRQSYFPVDQIAHHHCGIATARAGNVIGGGDWSGDRLVPDAVRAFGAGEVLTIRSPRAVRPWQHVFEPLSGYLTLAERVWSDAALAEGWNFGPRDADTRTVAEVIDMVQGHWGAGARWADVSDQANLHEAHLLKLDCSKARAVLGWQPVWSLEQGIEATVDWYVRHLRGEDMRAVSLRQLQAYRKVRGGRID